MSLHASALQQTAAQRHLWERLLASLPTPRQSPTPPPAGPTATPGAGEPSRHDAGISAEGIEEGEDDDEVSNSDSSSSGAEEASHGAHGGLAHLPDDGPASAPVHATEALQPLTPGKQHQQAVASSKGGTSSPAALGNTQPGGSHWAQVMANICSEYILACQGLARKAGGGMTDGALFTLGASAGAGVIVSMIDSPTCTALPSLKGGPSTGLYNMQCLLQTPLVNRALDALL